MKSIFTVCICLVVTFSLFGQSIIATAPLVTSMNSNARIGGVGEIGCVASGFYADAGLFQNSALLSKNTRSLGGSFSYGPWLKSHGIDMNLLSAALYFAISSKHAIGISVQDLDLGKIDWTDENGEFIKSTNWDQYYCKLIYNYSITNKLSVGADVKYINLTSVRRKEVF